MPFDYSRSSRVAIIGAGISGLGAAYLLARDHQVTLFEAAPRLGGHARTVLAGRNGDVPVDTGFIVFNYHTYPHLTKMFADLNVPVKKSDMSFGVSIDNGRIEYAMQGLRAMAAQSRNLARPQFWRMMNDILKFNKNAAHLAQDPDMTLSELLDNLNLGDWFRRYYLLPMSGAIWSSTPEQMKNFPARALVQFFQNHALLSHNTHDWYTVDGGSIQYVRRIETSLRAMGGQVRLNARVKSVRRHENGVSIRAQSGIWEEFDQVVFACHSDQALALLETPTLQENSVLGRIRYQDNTAVLHSDVAQMPNRRRAWASWVYRTTDHAPDPRIGITYWMNNLQGIDMSDPLFVSLNPAETIPDAKIYDVAHFAHPIFDRDALAAQSDLRAMQGANRSWYCGAWTRHGFHEDGYASAVTVAERLAYGKLVA